MKNDIEDMKKKIRKVLTKHGIVRAGIFGSYARGEQKKNSDVDILIEPPIDRKFSLLDLVGLEFELEKILNKKVDLLTYGGVNVYIKKDILNDELKLI